MRILKIAIVVFVVTALLSIRSYMSSDKDSGKVENKEIHCKQCGKDLTNDFNRISPMEVKGYYCMPCYNGIQRDIKEEMILEGYNVD